MAAIQTRSVSIKVLFKTHNTSHGLPFAESRRWKPGDGSSREPPLPDVHSRASHRASVQEAFPGEVTARSVLKRLDSPAGPVPLCSANRAAREFQRQRGHLPVRPACRCRQDRTPELRNSLPPTPVAAVCPLGTAASAVKTLIAERHVTTRDTHVPA